MMRRLVILACVLGVAGCGGRTAAVMPPVAPSAAKVPAKTAQVQFSITVPRQSSGRFRSPRYVSAATQSASIAVTPSGGAPATPVVVNCTSVCSGQIAAPVGSDTFTMNLFDAPNGAGNLLSTGTLTQTIVIDQANTVNVTFNGVVKSLAVVLNPSSVGSGAGSAIAVTVNALDAAGNVIVGPGGYADANGNALTVTLSDSDTSGATKLSTTSLSGPTTGITLSYNGTTIANPTVTAAAPGVAPAAKTLTIGASGCPGPGPNTDLYIATAHGISTFPLSASGNTAPLSTLSVAANDVAVDAQGTIYVTQNDQSSKPIEVFCSLASGNAAPLRTIVQPSPSTFFQALALDPAGNLYVSDFLGAIYEYAPGAGVSGTPSSNATPTPTTRALTKLGFLPRQIGVDGSGNVYAGNGFSVNVYGPSANGNAAAPSRQVTSLAANLTGVSSFAADAPGDVFVLYGGDDRSNRCIAPVRGYSCQAVGIYAAGSSGAPAHVLTFDSGKQLGSGNLVDGSATAIAADATGTLYVLSTATTQTGYAAAIAVYPPGSQDGDATPSRVITATLNSANDRWSAIAVDGSGNIYVTYAAANAANSDVIVYGPTGTAPARTLGNGSLSAPDRLAVGADGTAYVGQSGTGVIAIYAAGASGAQAPLRTLNVAASFPSASMFGLAVDASGTLYVRLGPTGSPLVAAYASGAGGSQAPARTFTDPFAALDVSATALAVDALGSIYVGGMFGNTVFAYPTSSSGTVSPNRRLSFVGASTRGQAQPGCGTLCIGVSAYVDAGGNLYVASQVSNSIQVYAPGAATPSRSIVGPNTQLLSPNTMAVDAGGNLYVNSASGTLVFGPAANGDATPLRILNVNGTLTIGPGP